MADLLTVPCDVLVPAARPDTIHAGNAGSVKARLVLSGANIPATAEAEKTLHRRGILLVPDFIANAGGVIWAVAELHGGTEASAFEQIAQKVRHNTRAVLERSRSQGVAPREAAVPEDEADEHREHRYVGQPGPRWRCDGGEIPRQRRERDDGRHRQRHGERPRDHLPAAEPARQRRPLRVAEAAEDDCGEHQEVAGKFALSAAAGEGEAGHRRRADAREHPE